jgi:hypothetical protein
LRDAVIDIGAALKNPLIMSHLHVLAAINSYITGPFWRLTEHSTTISTLTDHAEALIKYLKHVMDEPITGYAPFEDFEEAEEVTARSMIFVQHLDNTPPKHPDIVAETITYVAPPVLEYFTTKFAPYLEGGEHYKTKEDIRTVPRSNIQCESIFGKIGKTYDVAPNKRIARRGIYIEANVNKFKEWFLKKSPEEQDDILNKAIAAAPKRCSCTRKSIS